MSYREAQLPSELVDQLARLESQVRRFALLRGAGIVCLILGVGMAIGLAVDFFWELALVVRLAILIGVVLSTSFAVFQCVFRPWLRGYRLLELAAVVETAHPALRERLLSIVEFHDPEVTANYHGSALMRDLLSRQTVNQVRNWDLRKAVSGGRSFRTALLGLGMIAALAAPLAVSPSAYALLISRFFTPWANLDSAGDIVFAVHDGNRTVARGSDVTIRVSVRRRSGSTEPVERVWLNRIDPAGEVEQRRMGYDSDTQSFEATVPQVLAGFDYSISSGRARSRHYRIDAAPAPEIVAARLQVAPPPYTGLAERHFDGIIGEIPVFERSRLTMELTFRQPVEAAELEWLALDPGPASADENTVEESLAERDNERFTLAADRRSARLEMTADNGGMFAFRLRDRHGLSNENEPQRRLIVTRDAPPELVVAGSDEPRDVRLDEPVSVDVLARDDLGLGAVELHYETLDGQSGMLTPDPELLGRPTLATAFTLDPTALGWKDGAEITYRVRAADTRPVPKPNEVWSAPRMVTVRRNAESLDRQELADEQRRLERLLQTLKSDLAAHREKVAELGEEAEKRKQASGKFERNSEIPPLIAEEWEFAQRLTELADRFASNPILEPLAREAREIAQHPLRRAGDELRQAAEAELSHKVSKLQEAERALVETEDAVQTLDDRFQNLSEIVRDLLELGRLAQRAEKLADDAAALEQSQSGEAPSQAGASGEEQSSPPERQQALIDEQQELAADLEDLLERRPELVESARKAQLERLAELADVSEALAEPQEQLAEMFRTDTKPALEDDSVRQSAVEAREQQRTLAQESVAFALRVAQELGHDSMAAQQAAESARQNLASRADIQGGDLAKAGQSSQRAAEAALDAARELKRDAGTAESEMAQQARTLADQQLQLAEALSQLAQEPAARQAVRQQSQRELGGAARNLEQQFSEIAQRLGAAPLELSQESQHAGAAGQQSREAGQAMQDVLREIQERSAADPARAQQAAQALRDAASAARGGAAKAQQHESPIPGEIGEQVTDAAQKLRQAAEQLSQAAPPRSSSPKNASTDSPQEGPSNPSGESSSQSDSGMPQTTAQEASSGQSSGSPLADSVQNLQQAAQSLAQASRQLQPGQSGGESPPRSSNSSNPNSTSPPPGEKGDGLGEGATGEIDLTRFEADLGQLSSRNWGKLPGELQSQILQGARHAPDGEYAPLIRIYFQEIAKPATESPRADSGRER